ncbi:transposase [Bdellovibrio sp. NC01]|uniref:transposase n=1 Tax=Bdellovibrio sp. NC01 TaxID=2220073 RepID=UPI00143D4251|nr:transposase [Bdellovibrio sp. NC01]
MGRKQFINQSEYPYHVTARCINKEWFSQNPEVVWEVMTRNLYFINHAFNLRIQAFVLMSNHFHMLVRAPDGNISEAMKFFMTQTSKEISKLSKRINHCYGGRFHRTLIASPLYYLHAYKYVYRNPVTAGLVERVEDYKFSSLHGVLGNSWMEVPVQEDDNWGNWETRQATLAWLNTAPLEEDWDLVRKALKRPEFVLSKVNKRSSDLEFNAL